LSYIKELLALINPESFYEIISEKLYLQRIKVGDIEIE